MARVEDRGDLGLRQRDGVRAGGLDGDLAEAAVASTSEFCTAEIGAIATSSAFCSPVLPLACRTPTTVNWMLLSSTFWPTASVPLPKIDSAVVGPSTTTLRAAVTSSLVNSAPSAMSRFVVVKYAGSVPATVEMSYDVCP